jgi:hypothetical protein
MLINRSVGDPELDTDKALLAREVTQDDSEKQLSVFTYFFRVRSLSLTQKGDIMMELIMMGPRGCQPSDVLCVFLGSSLPTVLRPTDNGEFEIKGPACHAGLLDGKALLGELPEAWG